MKFSHLLALFSLLALPLAAQQQYVNFNGTNSGSAFRVSESGQAGTRVFTGNFYQPGGGGGQTVANVNIFTGQPSYSIPLYTLDARGEVAFPFALSFSGPTFPTVENNNDKAPVGWLGVGWSMQAPFVAINHKGTRTYSDDMIFCNLGPYGGGQILWEPATKRYFVATAPGIIVRRDTVSNPASPLYRQIKAWVFTIPATGARLVFGDTSGDTSSTSYRYLQHYGSMITASPYNADSSKPFVYRWDLKRMEDASGKTGLDFEYDRIQEPLWAGKGYIRESYLKKALWRDEYGNEIRRVDLELDTLQAGEYLGYFPHEAKTSQKPYETRYLKALSVYDEGSLQVKYRLKRNVKTLAYGKKAVLDSVTPFYGPTEKRGPGWAFSYRTGDQMLSQIITPSGAKERFEYRTMSLGATRAGQEGNQLFRDSLGNVVDMSNNGDGWRVEASCDDRFCYEIVKNDQPSPDRVFFRVMHNTGNYFESESVLNRAFQEENTNIDEWQFIPMGDYILIANGERAYVELWEWDGKKFRKSNDSVGEPGDPMRSNFGHGCSNFLDIEVHAGGPNYFLVYRKNSDDCLPRRVWAYLKDPLTGKWNNLTRGNRGSATCKLNNFPKRDNRSGGWRDPASTLDDSCFNWDTPVAIAANSRMFAMRESDDDVLYMYALNAQGTGFDSIGQLIPKIRDGVQEVIAGDTIVQNWSREIARLQMTQDFLVIKSVGSSGDTPSRFDFLFYDGRKITHVGKVGLEDEYTAYNDVNAASGSNDDRNLWFGPNYFVHSNSSDNAGQARVELWAVKQAGDSIYLRATGTLRTDVPIERYADIRVSTGPRYIGVEYMPNETFTHGIDPYKYPLVESGSHQVKSWLYRINDTAGVDSLPPSTYTLNYGGCGRKVWNMSFSGIDNVMMGTVHKSPSGCGDCSEDCNVKNVSFKTNLLSNTFSSDSIIDPISSKARQVNMKDRSWSLGDRLGMSMFIKKIGSPDTLLIRRYFYNGRSYGDSLSADVVSRFVREAASDSVYPAQVTEFDFTPDDTAFVTEFNHNSLTPQFEYAKVTQRGLPGGTLYSQYVDQPDYRLTLDSAGLAGRVRCVTLVDSTGDTLSVQYTAYSDPYSRGWSSPGVRDTSIHDPWPQGLAMNRPEKTIAQQRAKNRSRQTSRTYPYVWNDTLEAPLITVTRQANRSAVSQTLLDSSGVRVKRSLAYDYPADSVFLRADTLKRYRAKRLPLDSLQKKYGIASSKVDYDGAFPYKVSRTYGWRAAGGAWGNEQLKVGPTPNFNPDAGLFVASEVTKRDSIGQPLETLVKDGASNNYTSVFYEGRAALPIGVVTGARRGNSATLTAENGDIPQFVTAARLDRESRWESTTGTAYDSGKVHTGRYSFNVTDGFGPTLNLRLTGMRSGNSGFIASAWIYGDMDDAPIFSISRRHGDNSQQNEFRAAPVEGSYVRGKWQRWEARIPHADLVANGMFADSANDYLRFFVASIDTNPAFDPSRVIHVDDIVLRPDDAMFSLTAYDRGGRPTQRTDANHLTITQEYGFAGQPTVTRDERGRILGQSGLNKPGEN